MARTIVVGEVRTGRRITQIPVVDSSWSIHHRAPGTVSITVPLGAEEFRTSERRLIDGLYPSSPGYPFGEGPYGGVPFGGAGDGTDGIYPSPETFPAAAKPAWFPGDGLRPSLLAALEPVRCFVAVLEGDHVLEAGPIWTWQWDDASNRLTVVAKGMGSMFDHRLVVNSTVSDYAAWSATYRNMGRGTIAKRLVQLATAHTHGALPIRLPDDEAGDRTRTYRGFDLATVQQRINELMDTEDGPEVAFQPKLTEDRLGIEWDMRVGTETAPLLSQQGEDWQWRLGLPRGPVVGVSLSRDASGMTSEAFAADSAMEESKTIVRQQPADARVTDLREHGFPLMQSAQSRQGDSEDGSISPATLRAWARSDLQARNRPYTELSLTVDANAHPRLGTYRPGDWARLWVEGHPLLGLMWANGGYHRTRIASVSGGMDGLVNVGLMPALEGR